MTLATHINEKLAKLLPGARLYTAFENVDQKADPQLLVINLTTGQTGDSEQLTVTLPLAQYGSWHHDSLRMLLEQIRDNAELQLALSQQQVRYEAYLEEVKTTKEKLLPDTAYRIEGLEYARHYAPSIGGGGDYFDIVDLRNARRRAGIDSTEIFWGASLFDVSGHGPGAAVEVAMIDAILRTYQGGPGTGPGDVLSYVNRHFFTRQGRGGFVTGLVCNFDASSGEFRYANAGHLPLLVKRRDGDIVILDDHNGIPIGVDRDFQWETLSIKLDSGDGLVMMTDGITEARSRNGKEFGMASVEAVLQQSTLKSPDEFLSTLISSLNTHTGNNALQDDQTAVAIQLSH